MQYLFHPHTTNLCSVSSFGRSPCSTVQSDCSSKHLLAAVFQDNRACMLHCYSFISFKRHSLYTAEEWYTSERYFANDMNCTVCLQNIPADCKCVL
jgi:hypothetical protein